MVQEFHVVRCFSCQSFQSQQVCKKPKFCCKMCGEKQSVRKEYGRGSGKDCRIHVQKLNSLQGSLEAEEEQRLEVQLEEQEEFEGLASEGYPDYIYEVEDLSNLTATGYIHKGNVPESVCASKSNSKWSTYLTNEDDVDDSEVKTSSVSVSRQRHSQREVNDEGKDNSFGTFRNDGDCHSFGTFRNDGDCQTTQANSVKRMPVMQRKATPFFKPPVKIRPIGNETIPVKQHEPGPIRVQKPHIQESYLKGKSRLCSSPYPSVSCSELSQVYKSQNKSDKYKVVDSTSLQTGNYSPHSASSTGKFGTSGLMNDRQDNVMPLRKNVGNINFSINGMNSSNQVIKRKLEEGNDAGILKAEHFNPPKQMEPKNLKLRKQHHFVACIENSASAAFKKYELADDVEDIDFDL